MSEVKSDSRMTNARQNLNCCECGGFIKYQESYQRTTTVERATFHTCIECARIRKTFNGWFGVRVPYGQLKRYLAVSTASGLLRKFLANQNKRSPKTK